MCTVEQWRCRFLIDIENGSEAHLALVLAVCLYHRGTICRLKLLRGNFQYMFGTEKMWCRQSWGCKCTWQQKDGNKRILQLYFSRDDTAESSCQAKCNAAGPHPSYFWIYVFSPLMCSINNPPWPMTKAVFCMWPICLQLSCSLCSSAVLQWALTLPLLWIE